MKQRLSPTVDHFLTYLKNNAVNGVVTKSRREMAEVRNCVPHNISRLIRILEAKGYIKHEWPLGSGGKNPDGSPRLKNITLL